MAMFYEHRYISNNPIVHQLIQNIGFPRFLFLGYSLEKHLVLLLVNLVMDNSQTLDTIYECPDTNENSNMDTVCYDSLVCNTKKALQYGVHNEIKKKSFSLFFNTLLEDCRSCISQCFNLISDMLSNSNINIDKLIVYINDSVSLLQMLSDFIKTVVELVSLSCVTMKTFPTSTGQIIKMVFLHCKESDSIYGVYLSHIAEHLKNLFRSCHELQLTYLMVLEKHFVFDLSEDEQLNILDAALKINLEIGEIVEILDVKTMAEQWKAYTAICEKYSHSLIDKQTYNKCIEVICETIDNNMKTASEQNQEDKIILRAVKVSSFLIKILLKVINIFKQSSLKHQELILNLLINLYLKSYPCDENEKVTRFRNLMHTNILAPTEMLIRELLMDQIFINCLLNYEIHKIRQEDKLFGYILLLLSFMKAMVQFDNDKKSVISKEKIIYCIYNCLPYCHLWFNLGLKFNTEDKYNYKSVGLYEYALTYMTAFALTLTAEEYCILEEYIVKALLGTDYITALFSSNLWILLARFQSNQLLMTQLIYLCKIYRNCECNELFEYSPQKVHLSYTINNLFEVLKTADKIKVYNEIKQCNENVSLLCLLNVKSLPEQVRIPIEKNACEKFKLQFRKLTSDPLEDEDIDKLIHYMDLVALCSSTYDNGLIELLVQAWKKSCFLDATLLIEGDLNRQNLWFFQYIRALVSLTNSRRHDFCEKSTDIIKALHVLLNMAQSRNTELKLILFDFFFYVIEHEVCDDNKNIIDHFKIDILKSLVESTDYVVRFKLLCSLQTLKHSKKIAKMISTVAGNKLKQIWNCNIKQDFKGQTNDCKGILMKVSDDVFTHKCIENKDFNLQDAGTVHCIKHSSGNFDLADDIDKIFEIESDPEPVCKKAKFNNHSNEADVIITKLENDVFQLNKVKKNVLTIEQKERIREVCDKLKIVIH